MFRIYVNVTTIVKVFSKPSSPSKEPKTNKSIFQSEPEVLPCFEMNYKFLGKHKKPLSLATRGPENSKQKLNLTRRRSDNGRSARVDCHLTKEEINTFKPLVHSLGHFISFSFATKEIKETRAINSRDKNVGLKCRARPSF